MAIAPAADDATTAAEVGAPPMLLPLLLDVVDAVLLAEAEEPLTEAELAAGGTC